MPQPLKHWPKDTTFRSTALTDNTELGAYIARVSTAWTEAEVEIGLLLALILDMEARTGVHMYLALTGSTAQDKVLVAAAEARLSPDLQAEFTDLLSELRKRAAERNRVVHALWGDSASHPNALIHCPPDHLIRDVTKEYTLRMALTEIVGSESVPSKGRPSDEFVAGLMKYTKHDFVDIIERIGAFIRKIREFADRVSEANRERRARAAALKQFSQEGEAASPPDENQTNPPEQS